MLADVKDEADTPGLRHADPTGFTGPSGAGLPGIDQAAPR